MEFRKKTLPNGLRIVVAPMKSTRAVTLLVLIGTGSANEEKKINGVSHFLEHLYFKGTKNRPNPGQVHGELDRLGAEHNAFTSQEVTGYWIKAATKHFDTALDIVSDILLRPLFQRDEIEKERNVILQEIAMYEDIPQKKVHELLYGLLYGKQSLGWFVGGTPRTVKTIDRKDIVNYKNSHYKTSNTVVIIAGKINYQSAFKKVARAFSDMPRGRVKPRAKTELSQAAPKTNFLFKKTDQTHIALGIHAYDMLDKRKYILNLLSVILGGNTSSRLFTEIREKLGLAYYVGASGMQHSDTGFMLVNLGIAHENLEQAIKKIALMLKDIREVGVSKDELHAAKDFLRGKLALSFESSDEVAAFYGDQELFYKKIVPPEQHLNRIEKVSQNDIIKVARDIFIPKKINLAVIGPHRDGEHYKKILAGI